MFIPIRSISLSKLRKLGHSQLVEQVINVLQQFDLESLRLQNAMEMLLQLRPQLLKLEDKYGAHPLSKHIKVVMERRLELAGFISSQIQLQLRVNMEDQRQAVTIAKYPVRGCLLGIRKNDQLAITGKLNQFFNEVDKNSEILAAFAKLGLQNHVVELRKAHVTYDELFYERRNSIDKRPTRESKSIQKDCQELLRNLFAQIELGQKIYRDQDYSALINLLNTLLAKYTRSIKRRETYNRKRAEAKARKAAQVAPQTHILSVDGKETGSVVIGGKNEVKKKQPKSVSKKQAKNSNKK